MKYVIRLLVIVLVALSSCNENSSQTDLTINSEEFESELEKRDSIIRLLNTQLDSLKSQKITPDGRLCFNSENELYGKVRPEKTDCPEFAEHLNWIDTTINFFTGDYNISITNSCNGPSDADIDACNCSYNFYISTGSDDLPKRHELFRVGPYREPTNIQFSQKDQILRFNYLNKKDKTQTATIKINRYSVTVIK